ncbi:MAG: hypothetical protein GXP29_11165 [Planctomycetes bacterium]|nr:hypothetical protein [Planctomycetota bacterium]
MSDKVNATKVDAQVESLCGLELEAQQAIFDDFEDRPKRNEIVWRLKAKSPGVKRFTVTIDGQQASKEIAVSSNKYARVSPVRPGSSFLENVIYPAEAPASNTDVIQRIELDLRGLPKCETPIFGFNIHWVISFFVISMIAALVFKPFLKVRI